MSFYEIYSKYKNLDWVSIEKRAYFEEPDIEEFIRALSAATESSLENMARMAHEITLRHFGRVVQLYTPLYLSNYCDNACLYCGFNASNTIERKRLTLKEVEKEAEFISGTGLKNILILTGESRRMSPVTYIGDCVKILKKYFSSISIEVYPLIEAEYARLISEGVDGLTIYQEVYDEGIYNKMHPSGPKNDYRFRLDAPERGAQAGMRNVNIGALLGLNDWRIETLLLGLHAKYLQDKFPDAEIGVSIPRIRPQGNGFKARCDVADRDMARIITALRIFMQRLGIALSTRERPELRENLIPLGITRMSAGSTTRVGGHTIESAGYHDSAQFEISDTRNVADVKIMLEKKGYQAVFKDWARI